MQEKDLVLMRARIESLKRMSGDCTDVSQALQSAETVRGLRKLTHPASLSGTMRKTGIALALAPEPVTTVAGIVMVAGSFVIKRREPASLADLADEAAKQLSDLSSLSLADTPLT